jgi:Transport and Golgi organisation 2
MCSIVILFRPGHDWPVLIGANRDEMLDRASAPPGRHWPDRPQVVAGLDRLAGGSWLGLNDEGVVAGIMNRVNSLGPAPGKRSRGELVLEALDHADAGAAARALGDLEPAAYRPFNMLVADNREAFWLRNLGLREGWIDRAPIPAGLSMLTAHDRNDAAGSKRIASFLPRFERAAVPDPESGDWRAWETLLASREHAPDGGPYDAMTIADANGFGTVSSALIALAAPGRKKRPILRFANGRPDQNSYVGVAL